MMTRWRFLASAVACLAMPASLAPALAAPADPDPVAIVTSIYDDSPKSYAIDRAPWLIPSERPAMLSKSLVALWKKTEAKVNPGPGEVGPVDFDVTTNSQGMYVKSAKVVLESRTATRATVAAILTPDGGWFRKSPDDNTVRYEFIRENGRWKIDDIRSTDGARKWSLRGVLLENLRL